MKKDLFKIATFLLCLIVTQPKAFGGAVAALAAPGLDTMEHPELLPLFLPDGTETRQSSSYDPSGSNNDGNFRTAYTKYIDTNGEYVIFDAFGPGCLYRQQINVWSRGRKKEAGQAHIKYYFDDESKPRVDATIDDLFGGKIAPFTDPFAFLDTRPRFGILYYPFAFKKHLKVTTTGDFSLLPDPNGCWYQYTYLTYPQTNGVTTWAGPGQDSGTVQTQWNNLGSDPKSTAGNIIVSNSITIPDGKTAVLAELHGAGSIASLKLQLDPYGRKEFYHTTLRIYWDGAKKPAVEMPLGLFFGGGGETYSTCTNLPDLSLRTLFYGFDGTNHQFYCYWPMPYWHSARLELVNETGEDLKSVSCVIEYKPADVLAYPSKGAGYFYAKRTLARDAGHGLFNTAFEESGRGKVVGLSFYSNLYAMDGDEFTYIDGSRTPQVHGDGTEDDHNQGFGGDAYQKPLWGGLVNGYQTAYRVYYNDSYLFNQHIKINYEFTREGGRDNGGETDAVVFYYKAVTAGHLLLTDQLDVGDATAEAAHHYSVTGQTWTGTRHSSYDGYERDYEYDSCADDGRAFTGHSEFNVNISPNNDGVKLRRRLYRPENGLQRAWVYVDGVRVEERPWDVCTYSCAPKYEGWLDDDFEIPAAYTKGKKQLRVRVENSGGDKSEINEFYYWVFSYADHATVKAPPVKGVAASAAGSSQVELKWTAAKTSDQINYYQIERSETPDFSRATALGRSNRSRFSDSRVKPGTTYYYRVAAMNLSGITGPFSKTVTATTGTNTAAATAVLLGTDEITKGNWPTNNTYGSDGFILLRYFYGRDCRVLPDYLCAVNYEGFTNRQLSLWKNANTSTLVTSPISYCARYLGALETSNSGAITIYTRDDQPHQLSLYVCDYDKKGREESIEFQDLAGHVLVPATNVENFTEGKWLKFKFSGDICICLKNLNRKSTAVLSALMFDQPSARMDAENDAFHFTSSRLDVRMDASAPGLSVLDIDGLGLGKRGTNVLFSPTSSPTAFPTGFVATVSNVEDGKKVDYRRVDQATNTSPPWSIEANTHGVTLVSEWSADGTPEPLTLKFDASRCHATLLGILNSNGTIRLPALLHLPGQGSLRITAPGTTNATLGYTSTRKDGITVVFPAASVMTPRIGYRLEVTAIYPELPGIADDHRFDSFRRNWLNVLQLNPGRRQLANNSGSTSCAFCYYEYGDIALQTPPLADGLTALDVMRQTLDTIIAGASAYGLPAKGNFPAESSDTLPALIIAADDCVRGGGNDAWLAANYPSIKGWADKMLATDTNGDGLIKYIMSGNSGIWPPGFPKIRPANWWDTIGFGHEDAYGNALAFRALNCMTHMAAQLGEAKDAVRYRVAAEKLRAAYFKTFYNPDTGILGGWRSADGQLHDYYFLWVNGIAIHYGLVPKNKAGAIMDRLMAKMSEVGYTNFNMGLPGNLITVALKDYVHRTPDGHFGGGVRPDNADGFQKYENGGATGCFAYFTLAALYDLGRRAEADRILFPMLAEYDRGGFEGRDALGHSNDWRMWDGTAKGYEGFLTDNYYTMLAVLERANAGTRR